MRARLSEPRPCAVSICDRDITAGGAVARGLCPAHYQRWRTGHPSWDTKPLRVRNGAGSYVSGAGYIYIYCPDHPNAQASGAVFEHILVMSEALGRPLLRHENVHHLNDDRRDNRLTNLELWSTKQPSGQRIEDRFAWAREILAEYGQKVCA